MLDRDQVRARRNAPSTRDADAEHMLGKPVIKLDPAQHHRQSRASPEQARNEPGQHPQEGRRIEQRREQQRPQKRHQMSAHTARRRSTIFVIFAEQGEEARLGPHAVGHQPIFAPEHLARIRSARGACASRW